MSASESNLKKLDVEQAQALRICPRAFKSSLQVETGEMPLRIRRVKIMLAYWINIQGHSGVHPTKAILQDCSEHSRTNYYSFGWIGNVNAQNASLSQLQVSPTVALSTEPPCKFTKPSVDISLQQMLKEKSKIMPQRIIVQNYMDLYRDKLFIFTDGSKQPETGRTGAAFFISHYEMAVKKGAADHLSVYTVELLAILLALQWLEGNKQNKNVIIASDSLSALSSIQSGKPSCRQDIIYQIFNLLLILYDKGLDVSFLWVPAHVGVEGNEIADILARRSIKHETVDIQIPLCRTEIKTIIKGHTSKIWQEYWDIADTGRHLYNIQNK